MPTAADRGVQPSPTRKLDPLALEAKAEGKEVLGVHLGNLDIPSPPEFWSQLRKFNEPNLSYAPSTGFREHVMGWQNYYQGFGLDLELREIMPTLGGSEAIFLALAAVANSGDEVLICEPTYQPVMSMAAILGIKLVPITLDTSNNCALPSDKEIESKIKSRTKAIFIINPGNPEGKVWSEEELARILAIAKKHDIFLIVDETYRELLYDGKEGSSILTKADGYDRVIVIDSVSKRYSLMGLRIGSLVTRVEDVMARVLSMAQARLCVGTLGQFASTILLNDSRRHTDPVRVTLERRRDVVHADLSGMDGVVCAQTQGAFYHLPELIGIDSSENFAEFLIRDFSHNRQTLLVAPAQGFYLTPGLGLKKIRIADVLEEEKLKRAMDLLFRGLRVYLGN